MPAKKPTRTIEQILKDKERKAALARENGKKGGRPKGSTNKPKPGEPPPQPKPETLDEAINRLKADMPPPAQEQQKQAPPEQEQQQQQQAPPAQEQQQGQQAQDAASAGGILITGGLALVAFDAFVSGGLALALRRFGWKGLKKSDLQLTPEEVEQLTPLANELVKMIVMNPLAVFGIAYAGCLLSKIPPRPEKDSDSKPKDEA